MTRAHCLPLTVAVSLIITSVSLCRAPMIVPFGRLRTFNGVAVGSTTAQILSAAACAELANASTAAAAIRSFLMGSPVWLDEHRDAARMGPRCGTHWISDLGFRSGRSDIDSR